MGADGIRMDSDEIMAEIVIHRPEGPSLPFHLH